MNIEQFPLTGISNVPSPLANVSISGAYRDLSPSCPDRMSGGICLALYVVHVSRRVYQNHVTNQFRLPIGAKRHLAVPVFPTLTKNVHRLFLIHTSLDDDDDLGFWAPGLLRSSAPIPPLMINKKLISCENMSKVRPIVLNLLMPPPLAAVMFPCLRG